MADRPILFSGPMVRALLAGTKTQTRRTFNPQPTMHEAGDCTVNGHRGSVDYLMREIAPKHWLRIAVGDRLYVREAWRPSYGAEGWREDLGRVARPADFDPQTTAIEYLADGTRELGGDNRPGIHMPRWASRITLTVTDVRVERLQSINAVDALAEGVSSTDHWRPKDVEGKPFEDKWWDDFTFWSEYPQLAYRELWEAINGAGSWEANPWVAAYSFTVEHGNIDRLARAA